MEADNQSKSNGDFQQENDSQFDLFSLTTENSSSNTITTEELMISKIYEKLGCLSVEIETVNTVLLEKNNTLVARLETMEQKFKVAELEKKLANEEMVKAIEQMEEKQRKCMEEMERKFEKKLQLVKSEMAEENAKLKKKEESHDGEEKKAEESKKLKFMWRTNKWDISDHFEMSADGLVVTNTNKKDEDVVIYGSQPITREILASMPGLKLVYYEVELKKSRPSCFGWVGPDFPLNASEWVGGYPGSFGLDYVGDYYKSDNKVAGYANGFRRGDVIGSGVLLTRDGRLKLFFTKNGRMNGKPIPLDKLDLLYSAITIWHKDASVEANFGAEPEKKPFKFDVEAHEAQLFV